MTVGKLPLSVIVSAAAHAVLVAWVTAHEFVAERDVARELAPTLTMVDVVTPPPPLPPVIAEPAAVAVPVAAVEAPRRSSRIAATTKLPTSEPVVAPTPATTTPSRHPYFDMRRNSVDLSLPPTRDDLEHVPAGTTPQAPATTPRRKTDRAYAKVDADGKATVKDPQDFSIGWDVPTPKQIGRGFAEWYASDKGPDGKRGKRTLEDRVMGTIDKPTVGCEGSHDNACSPDRSLTVIIPIFRGGFNPTDWLMRRTVGDPYASKKREYLDSTREERAEIRARHRALQLKQTSLIIKKNLEHVWSSTTDTRARKQLLFELWDEIDKPTGEDSLVAEASRAARAQVVRFIRARLPQRDSDAYTPDEIAALNAKKQSTETFAPYE